METIKKNQLENALIERNLINRLQLDAALSEQKKSGKKLSEILEEMGFLKKNDFLQLLSDQLKIPFIDLSNYTINPDVIHLLSEFDAKRLHSVVLNKDEKGLIVGMIDPLDILASDELQQILQDSIQVVIISDNDFKRVMDIHYRHKFEISSLSEELSIEMGKSDYDLSRLVTGISSADAPVVKLLQSIFEDATQVNASDIHIEPDEKVLRLRLRIDGVLHEQILSEKKVSDALSLRLKLMAGLNIAEKRMPQDGRFSITIQNKKFDVRLSSLPSQYGESIVMRLLNQSAELLSLSQMGMPKNILNQLRKIIALPHGILLITGPTGSGKTTTLYAMLTELNKPDVKIITVEDPVEYRLSRITQVQVQSSINLTFARALRSILRQDPDIIMIGELRDQETVEIALRAAMTGHFVFATLHTNDAMSSPERLVDMGGESFLVASVLSAVLSQRLVRRICRNCIEDHILTPQEESWLLSVSDRPPSTFKCGKGCPFCYESGYRGQVGIYELLVINKSMAEALQKNDKTAFVECIRHDKTYQSLLENGLKMAAEGMTTIEEVMQVSSEIFTDYVTEGLIKKTEAV